MTLYAQYQARAGGGYSDIRGHLDFIYGEALRLCARGRGRPVDLAELGVRSGNSTCALLAAIEVAGSGDLWSVDIAEPQVPDTWHGLEYWHFRLADDLSAAARLHIRPRLDLLFIDTSHSQDHTMAELAAYGPRVRPGGLILCHDTQWDEGDTELDAPVGPVARALDDWCTLRHLKWENRPGSFGLGVIRVPGTW